MNYLLLYMALVSLISFLQFIMDKNRARNRQWRISEKTLLLTALAGGAPGAFLGMHLVRHKTKHWYFRWGIPVFLLLQAGLISYLCFLL